jgi:hypothetical protein
LIVADPSIWTNPAMISAIGSLIGVTVTLVGREWFDRHKARQQNRHTDHELLSMDQQKFREVLIQELTATRVALDHAEKSEKECLRRELSHEKQISRLEWSIEYLCKEVQRINPTFDISVCQRTSKEE